MKLIPSLLIIALLLFCRCTSVQPPAPYGVLPTAHQVAWQKMEMNLFVHFGPNTFTSAEWGDGHEDVNVFNPTELDCRQWTAVAKQAGMKGIVLTAKHHDGYCLWPTAESTHSVAHSKWRDGKGDILKELSEACKADDLKFGVYLSPWDQNHPTYGTDEYNAVFCRTLDEVLTNYGHVFEQWFDGACGEGPNGKRQRYDWDMFNSTVLKNQPHAVIFSDVGPGCRWIGNEIGIAGETCWSTLNIDGFSPGKSPHLDTLNCGNYNGSHWVPGEVDVSIRPGWFYRESEDTKVKSVAELMKIYYASVGRNCLLLLNVPADKRGLIPAVDSIRLNEFRTAIENVFAVDYSRNAKINVSNTRGGISNYDIANALDNKYDTYWATDDSVHQAVITLDLNERQTINRVMLQEYIPLGQRVTEHKIEVRNDANESWQEVSVGTNVGYKRIACFETVTASQVRISLKASAPLVINNLGIFYDEGQVSEPEIIRSKDGVVTINSKESTAKLYYTLDGSDPTEESQVYTESFTLPLNGVIRAFAVTPKGASAITTLRLGIAPSKFSALSPLNGEVLIDGDMKTAEQVASNTPVIIDMGQNLSVSGFYYVPLQDKKFGCVSQYDLELSADNVTWETVLLNKRFDNIANNPLRQDVEFDKTYKARFIKFTPKEIVNGKDSYFITELGIYTN